MYSGFIKKGDLVFDVGANVGNRVDTFLSLKAKVIAIEPQPHCRKILKLKFGNKISILDEGLGEKEEIKTMYISSSNTLSSFSKDWIDAVKKKRFQEEEWNQKKEIKLTTLDKLISLYGKPSFIKIDVEGFELQVLKGLTQVIKMISFEYTVPEQTSKAIECVQYLNSLCPNYRFNYSLGETMQMKLMNFVSYDEFMTIMLSESFQEFNNGDIYATIKD